MNATTARLIRIKNRIDAASTRRSCRFLIQRLARDLEPEAIDLLIQLLDDGGDRADIAESVLVRYGEAAEQPLRDVLARASTTENQRFWAQCALKRIEHRARLEQVLGNFGREEVLP